MLPGPNTSEGAHAAQQMSAVPQKPDLIGQVRDRQQCATSRHSGSAPRSIRSMRTRSKIEGLRSLFIRVSHTDEVNARVVELGR